MVYMMNKRGQFYLVAAIIIVLVLAGISSVKTYAIVSPEPRAIKDLGSELQEETSRIVDYGIYNVKQDLNSLLNNFTNTKFAPYFLQKTSETGIVFLYGNKTDLEAIRYNTTSTGVISATIGTLATEWNPVTDTFAERIDIIPIEGQEEIVVNITGKEFEFKLQDNQMFYFVIVQEKNGETYVETNK